MKTIIAGGRKYQLTADDREELDTVGISEVVSGKCEGADSGGEEWAKDRGIRVKEFPADWEKYGKSAGPIRNRLMAEYADAVVLFPGDKGTQSMCNEAIRAGIRVYDWRYGQ